MEDSINNLVYLKYEQFSSQYVISLQQIELFIEQLKSDLSLEELNSQLDVMINTNCYYNLLTSRLDDFNDKLKHNIELAKLNQDTKFLTYLAQKFNINDDLESIDLSQWEYKSNKIKIKLKVNPLCPPQQFCATELLAGLLKISPEHKYKHASDIIRLIHKYIYDNSLQDIKDKKIICPDENLMQILLPLEESDQFYTYYNLPKYTKHLIKFS